jgi:hypothetical protein
MTVNLFMKWKKIDPLYIYLKEPVEESLGAFYLRS